jgi:hypothetical protein
MNHYYGITTDISAKHEIVWRSRQWTMAKLGSFEHPHVFIYRSTFSPPHFLSKFPRPFQIIGSSTTPSNVESNPVMTASLGMVLKLEELSKFLAHNLNEVTPFSNSNHPKSQRSKCHDLSPVADRQSIKTSFSSQWTSMLHWR